MNNEEFNNKKCYNCGKLFRTPADLLKHKNRKTPCLIREVDPKDANNPLRCIFCNKIFSKKENLTRHLKICKVKNGGINILDEKIRYEQEIRILKEQREKDKIEQELKNKQKDDEIKQMRERMVELETQMKQLVINQNNKPQEITNITNINNGIINNFNFYNYNTPKTDALKLTQEDLKTENLMKKLIELIYFNANIPENHVLYRPNVKEDRYLVYKDNDWANITGDNFNNIFRGIQNAATEVGDVKVNSPEIYTTEEDFMKLIPSVRDIIQSYNMRGEHAIITEEQLKQLILEKRNTPAQTLRRNKIKI